MAYLNREEINTIGRAAQAAGLGTKDKRHALLDALNADYAATLVDKGGGPLIQLLSDLNAMNLVDQLSDGSVPLLEWLRQAGFLAGATQRREADVFTKYEAQVHAKSQQIHTADEVSKVLNSFNASQLGAVTADLGLNTSFLSRDKPLASRALNVLEMVRQKGPIGLENRDEIIRAVKDRSRNLVPKPSVDSAVFTALNPEQPLSHGGIDFGDVRRDLDFRGLGDILSGNKITYVTELRPLPDPLHILQVLSSLWSHPVYQPQKTLEADVPRQTFSCETLEAGDAAELPNEPMLYLKEFTTLAEAKKYGFFTGGILTFIEKDFDPNISYLFHSPRKTGKSSLLTLLVRALEDSHSDKGPFVFLKISHIPGSASTAPEELFQVLNTWQDRENATPILLVDNIHAETGLHAALLALKEEPGAISDTPIWGTALTDSLGTVSGSSWRQLLGKLKRVEKAMPGLLYTREGGDIDEFLARISDTHGRDVASAFRDVIQESPRVTIFYLSELWHRGKRFLNNISALRKELASVPFSSSDIFFGIYGAQSNVSRSAISIACYEAGISKPLLDSIVERANGCECKREIDQLLDTNVLWLGAASDFSGGKPTVQYIDGIQDVALTGQNFPPARKKEILRSMLEISPDDPNFSETALRLDQRFSELDVSDRRKLCDALLAAPVSEPICVVASRHIDFEPRLLAIWKEGLSGTSKSRASLEAFSRFGMALLALKRCEEAIKCFVAAAKCAEHDHRLLVSLANAYSDCQKWDEALGEYRKAVRIAPGERDVVAGFLRALLSMATSI